jgi:hypothetical protein
MRRGLTTLALAVALGASLSPRTSGAYTLTLSPAASLYDAGNTFFLSGIGVGASVGESPIPPTSLYGGLPPPPIGTATGSMSLTPVGAGDQFDVRFSVSLFSDSDPYVLTGSYAPTGVPVVLRINEISFEVTAPSDPPARFGTTATDVPGLSAVGSIRGSLTVGTTTVPFSDTETGCCGFSDASVHGGLFVGPVSPSSAVIGFDGGPGIFSSFGVAFPGQDLITLDGVTFSTTNIDPWFFDLLYVPEPSSSALLAGAAFVLLLRAMRFASR